MRESTIKAALLAGIASMVVLFACNIMGSADAKICSRSKRSSDVNSPLPVSIKNAIPIGSFIQCTNNNTTSTRRYHDCCNTDQVGKVVEWGEPFLLIDDLSNESTVGEYIDHYLVDFIGDGDTEKRSYCEGGNMQLFLTASSPSSTSSTAPTPCPTSTHENIKNELERMILEETRIARRRRANMHLFRREFSFGLIDNVQLTVFPLQSIDFSGEVMDSIFINNVTMVFQNPQKKDAFSDISFVFPIDPGAAIYDLGVKIGKRDVRGIVEEKEKASKDFKAAKKEGHGVYRGNIDASQRDVHHIDVGNLPPGEQVTITLRYITQLNLNSLSSYRLSIPLGLYNRYRPGGFEDKNPAQYSKTTDTAVNSYSVGSFPISIALQVFSHNKIASINSPTQSPFELTFIEADQVHGSNGQSLLHPTSPSNKIRLRSELTSAAADYVLTINFKDEIKSSLLLPSSDSFEEKETLFETYLSDNNAKTTANATELPSSTSSSSSSSSVSMVSIMPTSWKDLQFSEDQPFEIFFVIDQSGSMSGSNIDLAKKTLSLCINGLPDASTFNIIGFGSAFIAYFNESKEFDDVSKRDALKVAYDMSANLGGTEILAPLEHIQRSYPRINGKPRYVFLLTDGEVFNQDQVVELARNDHFTFGTKYFTFGIGTGASRGLVEETAKASNGAFEMIDDGDVRSGKVAEKVLRQLARVIEPALSNISISWSFRELTLDESEKNKSTPSNVIKVIQQSPNTIPTVFKDSRQLVFVEFDTNASIVRDAIRNSFIKGSLPAYSSKNDIIANEQSEAKRYYEEIVDNTYIVPGSSLRALAAKSFLRDLDIIYDLAASQEEKESIKNRAIEVSKRSGVVCRFTSFIAIERRDDFSRVGEGDMDMEKENSKAVLERIYLSSEIETVYSLFDGRDGDGVEFRESARLNTAVGLSVKKAGIVSASLSAPISASASRKLSATSRSAILSSVAIEMGVSGAVSGDAMTPATTATATPVIMRAAPMYDPSDMLASILQEQSTDGSWKDVHQLCLGTLDSSNNKTGGSFLLLKSKISNGGNQTGDFDLSAIVAATVTNHICIQQKFPSMQTLFELSLRKSARFIRLKTKWLAASGGGGEEGKIDISRLLPDEVARLFKPI